MLGEPTSAPASDSLQRLFGVRPTGWAGRSFQELSDVPERLKALAGGTWNWSGPGIVLMAPGVQEARVVVLDQSSLVGRIRSSKAVYPAPNEPSPPP